MSFTFNSFVFDQKFQSLALAADVTQDELPVAKFMFFSGLRYGLKQDASPIPRVESSLTFPQIVPNLKITPVSNNLTASEAQSLKDILKDQISTNLEIMQDLKVNCRFSFELADTSTDAGQYMFAQLNENRNALRRVKLRNKQLQEIQRKLKKISRRSK